MPSYPFQPEAPTTRRCITCGEKIWDNDYLSWPAVAVDPDDPEAGADSDALCYNLTYCSTACVPPAIRALIRENFPAEQLAPVEARIA